VGNELSAGHPEADYVATSGIVARDQQDADPEDEDCEDKSTDGDGRGFEELMSVAAP